MAKFIITVMPTYPIYVSHDIEKFPTMSLIRALRVACPGMNLLDAKNAIVAMRDTPAGVRWHMTGDQFTTFCGGLNVVDPLDYQVKQYVRFENFIAIDMPDALNLTTYTPAPKE